MNTLRKNVLIGLAALSLGGAAIAAEAPAQPPAPQARAGHHLTPEQRQARMAEHFAKREAELHGALKLTPAQEPAWNAFVAATRPAPREHGDRAEWASLSAPARLQKMIDISKQRTAMMESHLSALNTFYSTLSPEQKRLMDQHMMRDGDGRGEHRWHRMEHEKAAQG